MKLTVFSSNMVHDETYLMNLTPEIKADITKHYFFLSLKTLFFLRNKIGHNRIAVNIFDDCYIFNERSIMAVYAVYVADSYRPVHVARSFSETTEWTYTAYEVVRYDYLTPKQVERLTYAGAKACEAILKENYASTLQ